MSDATDEPSTDRQTWCYASKAGCKQAGLGPYHWCIRPTGHDGAHQCRCGVEFPNVKP
jgi:hypothetical protein